MMPAQNSLTSFNSVNQPTMSSREIADLVETLSQRFAGRPGYVYILESTCCMRVKVGMSKQPEARLRALTTQSGGSGRRDVFGPFKNARAVEGALHKALNPLRVQGEWFTVEYEALQHFVRQSTAPLVLSDQDYAEHQRGISARDEAGGVALLEAIKAHWSLLPTGEARSSDDVSQADATGAASRPPHGAYEPAQLKQMWEAWEDESEAHEPTQHNHIWEDESEVHPNVVAMLAKRNEKKIIRVQLLNDGADTPVFHAQDVCAAADVADCFTAARSVSEEHLVVFGATESDDTPTRQTWLTWEGAMQVLRSDIDAGTFNSAALVGTVNELTRLRDEALQA